MPLVQLTIYSATNTRYLVNLYGRYKVSVQGHFLAQTATTHRIAEFSSPQLTLQCPITSNNYPQNGYRVVTTSGNAHQSHLGSALELNTVLMNGYIDLAILNVSTEGTYSAFDLLEDAILYLNFEPIAVDTTKNLLF